MTKHYIQHLDIYYIVSQYLMMKILIKFVKGLDHKIQILKNIVMQT